MPMRTISAREFNQNLSSAKKDALEHPVVITDRGEPTHVLMSYAEYEKLTGEDEDFVSELLIDEPVDFEVEPIRIGLKPVEF